MKKRGLLLFVIVVLAWGFNWTVMKIGLRFVSPLNLVSQRLLFASIALSPILAVEKRKLPKDGATWLKLISISVVNAACMASTHVGLLYEPSGLSSILTYTQPLFVFCLAALFLGEKVTLTRILGIVFGFLGVVAIYMGRLNQVRLSSASLFLILGAFLWAVTIIFYKKFLAYVNPEIVNVMQFPVGAAFLILLTSMLDKLTFSTNMVYVLSVLYTAIVGSAVASTIWLYLIKIEEAIVVSTSSLAVPAVALIFGSIFLGEVIEYNSLLGFILISAGIYFVNKKYK
ncbi:MAG: EamA family transporter [Candidatus Bathyarchaeia archaeon]|nr:EamA family transporter [Candidatus Bathyarchaeota archaeon]